MAVVLLHGKRSCWMDFTALQMTYDGIIPCKFYICNSSLFKQQKKAD